MTTERRRFPRVKLRQPLRGAAANARIYVLDASVGGLRIAHQGTLPPPGAFVRVELMTEMGSIKVDCQIMRTTAQPSITQAQKPIFQSALVIVAAADRQSAERLKTLFAQPPADGEETQH